MSEALRVVLASRNAGKAREFDRMLGPMLAVEALPPAIIMPEETGFTFAENARLKAQGVFDALERGVSVLADDSGLEVTCLNGRPGVLSARFAGESASDEENVAKLLSEMAGQQDRNARFVCCLCLMMPGMDGSSEGTRSVEVEGVLEGRIALEPRGSDGFGYDPVFLPAGWTSTLAEVDPFAKDEISHRGAASRNLLQRMRELGAVGEPG